MQEKIQQTIHEVFILFDKYGKEDYIGEPISQIEHACQSAQLAEEEGFDEEVILAAFFHDIGHLCAKEGIFESMDGYGVKRHEQIGADFLRSKGFSEKTARLVENHVQAKRYLTFKYPTYYQALSEASKKTLEFQGGKMTEMEATNFENDTLFSLSIQMRTWDEKAKEIGVALPELNKYKQMAIKHLSKSFAL
ncbi:phosphonate degradation HD-domain oxygenase [Thermoflexibacter ruber]|uniref:Phosphonate degradation operons associated HDIG domain protein n=1 Tax=Thermoflexibacter ruber TaxID=1003 RepID=A0A1I2AUR3_9BACT|nr:phosphonate degradation HD-domain oxygenase [Thermoflexibacter ruber]SFE47735.1 phosphonate degradation operons associated HDIG domain protein [Thermoflexibacter ruber]